MKQCLVYETLNQVSELTILESKTPNTVRLSGVFGVCGIKNGNNRIYDKANYGMMVESLQKVIAAEGCPGELEHPNSMNINLENVSHKIESIQMNEDGTVTGTILLLNTPKGKIAQALVEGGLPLFISSRGAGSIDESGHVTLSTIKTYDLVGTPGFSQAKLNLSENQTFECLNESLCIITESDDKDDKPKKHDDKDDNDDDDCKFTPCEKNTKNKDVKTSKNDNMTEIKETVDFLKKEVADLKTQLHVAQENLEDAQDMIDTLQENQTEVNYDAIENWVKNEFAPRMKADIYESVQNWVCEEFAPEVQNWVCEEFAPVVDNWINEEFGADMKNWCKNDFANEVYENFNTFMESKHDDVFKSVDSMLEAIEGKSNTQEAAIAIEESLKDRWDSNPVVANMPANYKPLWNMCSESKKEDICNRARLYDFNKAGVLENFWSSVSFEEAPKQIQESIQVSNYSVYQNAVLAGLKRLGRKF